MMTTEMICSGIRSTLIPQVSLETIAMQNDVTMLDTCSIMQPGFPSVIGTCAKKLNGLNSCIGFPSAVCRLADDGKIEEWEAEEDDIRAENDQDDIFGRLRF